jgi:hypothetical protein
MIGRVWTGLESWGLGRATAVEARRRAVEMKDFMLDADVVVAKEGVLICVSVRWRKRIKLYIPFNGKTREWEEVKN